MIGNYCTKVRVRLHVFWDQEQQEKACVWGRREGNEKRWGCMLQIMVWGMKQISERHCYCCSLCFSPNHQAKFTSQRAQRKDVPPRDMEQFWVHCPAVLSPLWVTQFLWSSLLTRITIFFSFTPCLLCLFKNKNCLFQQATKWKISLLEVELGSK